MTYFSAAAAADYAQALAAAREADARAELRDRFAMAALTGLLASPGAWGDVDCTPMHGERAPQTSARWAYVVADAMVEARKA